MKDEYQQFAHFSAIGRLPRRSVRSKSILPEEKVLVDLSMMDESRFYKMKGVAGDGLACKDDLQPGAPVIEYRGESRSYPHMVVDVLIVHLSRRLYNCERGEEARQCI